jgi:hypothetical protein
MSELLQNRHFTHLALRRALERNGLVDKRGCQEHFSPSAGGAGLVRDIQTL